MNIPWKGDDTGYIERGNGIVEGAEIDVNDTGIGCTRTIPQECVGRGVRTSTPVSRQGFESNESNGLTHWNRGAQRRQRSAIVAKE